MADIENSPVKGDKGDKADEIAQVENGKGAPPEYNPAEEPAIKGGRRGLQPPDFLLHMSMEERLALEAKLKRKIDLRLMPAIIVMYILNYIDRYGLSPVSHHRDFYVDMWSVTISPPRAWLDWRKN